MEEIDTQFFARALRFVVQKTQHFKAIARREFSFDPDASAGAQISKAIPIGVSHIFRKKHRDRRPDRSSSSNELSRRLILSTVPASVSMRGAELEGEKKGSGVFSGSRDKPTPGARSVPLTWNILGEVPHPLRHWWHRVSDCFPHFIFGSVSGARHNNHYNPPRLLFID